MSVEELRYEHVETSQEVMKAKTNTTTREESAIIERVARIVSSVRGSKPDYTRLAAELEQALPFDIFGVVLLRHDREAVRVAVCRRQGEGWLADYHQHPYKGSMVESVVRNPELQVRDYAAGLDGSPVESGDALSGNHQLRATVVAPLLIEDRVLGTLEMGSAVSGIYRDEGLQRLIKAVCHVLASAIESAQSSGSAEMQDRQRKALKDVSSALTSEVELSTILKQIVEGIAKALQVASAVVTINRREGRLSLEAQSGWDDQVVQKAFNRPMAVLDNCIIGESLLQQQVKVSQDISTDERYTNSQALFQELHMSSICSYPLEMGNSVYGALLLCSAEPGGFTPLKVDILSLFASQATVAIHNCMLLEAAQQRSRFQETIEKLEQVHLRAMGEKGEEDGKRLEYEMLEHIREETQSIFGVSFSSLLRFISNHLLTLRERDLHAILQEEQEEQPVQRSGMAGEDQEREEVREVVGVVETKKEAVENTIAFLSHTAEVAILSTDMLGELSRLLLQLQHTTANGVKDAWFVVDVQGKCVYMNPVAEKLCDIRLENPLRARRESGAKIESVFARLSPRIRNNEEFRNYLEDLGKCTAYRREMNCIVGSMDGMRPSYSLPQGERSSGKREPLGEEYHYQFKRYPLYNQQGQFIAHALQVHDRTEQVRDEKNRSALFSTVSHDLRTPLTTIKVAVTGLLQADLEWEEEDRKEILQDIERATDHLTILVSALVEMSKIEMGALSLDKEWCNIVEVFYGARKKIEKTEEDCAIKLRIEVDEQGVLPLVYADHVQLERVFFYLLENAVYYCGEHRAIEVRIGVEDEYEERQKLRVVVTDQGRRVGSEEKEKNVGEYTTSVYGPDGLGLAICKGIIEAHRGEIRVEQGEEGGTNCTFILPAHVSLVGGEVEGEERERASYLGEARDFGEQERVGEKR